MPELDSRQEHPKSYYAATANPLPLYPELKGSLQVDVCVIGAGFTGLSAALCLVERGYSVAVLEANRVGWGASGRNGGQLIGGISGEHRLISDPSSPIWFGTCAGVAMTSSRIAFPAFPLSATSSRVTWMPRSSRDICATLRRTSNS